MSTRPSAAHRFPVTRTTMPVPADERERRMDNPVFGTVFTDHMAYAVWHADSGWSGHEVRPLAPLPMHPGAAVLHYAQQVFEGLKAFKQADGSVAVFRPDRNAARMAASSARMALPVLPEEDFLAAIDALVAVDKSWVPSAPGASLYLRPVLFGTEPSLLVVPPQEVTFTLTACSVGAYLRSSAEGVSIWITRDYHRANEGGTGEAKTSGNYAASMLATQQAHDNGCGQVLFLDAKEGRYVEELGAMTLMVVMQDGSVRTPPLGGTILPGVIRDSIIQLLRDEGRAVIEERLELDQLLDDIRTDRVAEVFACGTAANVTSVGRVKGDGIDERIATGAPGPVTLATLQRLTDIQYGRAEDTHGWMRRIA